MGWLMTLAIGIVSMIIAAAISSGWLAFVIGVIVAVILVALVSRGRGDHTLTAH
jgi:tetrahydromethanopterin S-methyltransferase subunit C